MVENNKQFIRHGARVDDGIVDATRFNDSAVYNRSIENTITATIEFNSDSVIATPHFNGIPLDGSSQTLDSFGFGIEVIPAGAFIKEAFILVEDGIALGATTLDIGLFEADGTAIDADGLVADATAAELVEGILKLDGALIGTKMGDVAGYIKATQSADTAFTGKGKLVVTFYV